MASDDSFRAEVQAFIAAHGHPMQAEGVRVPRDLADEAHIRAWLASLYDAGFLGGGWPEAWGGRAGHHPMHDLIVMEELILGDAYRPLDQVMLASHALLSFGSDAQKAALLPRIRSGEHIWCQLFSEPDAGSDLAVTAHEGGGRRRRVPRDGPEDLEHRRPVGRHGRRCWPAPIQRPSATAASPPSSSPWTCRGWTSVPSGR